MKQNFVWKVQVTEPAELMPRLWDAMERLMAFNRHMSNAMIESAEDHCLIRFHFEGRDRWWIHSRAKYAAIAICGRAKIHPKSLELLRVERVDTGHDLKKPNRTERQQAADKAKSKQGRWEAHQESTQSGHRSGT